MQYDEVIELIETLLGRLFKEGCFRNIEIEDAKLNEIDGHN